EWLNELLETKGFPSAQVPVLPFENRRAQRFFATPETVEISVECAVTEYFLLACWHCLLWRLTGQADIPIVRVGDGRSRPELKAALGVFARPLPSLAHFGEAPVFNQILRQVSEGSSEAERCQERLSPEEVMGPAGDSAASPMGFEFVERMPK